MTVSVAYPNPTALALDAGNRAHSTMMLANIRVPDELALVVSDPGFRDGALGLVALALGAGVVRRQHRRGGADDGADLVVQLPALGLLRQAPQRRAGRGVGRVLAVRDRDRRVLVQVVVVVGRGIRHGTDLAGLVDVEVRVGWREDCVGRADDRADFVVGSHICDMTGFSFVFCWMYVE